MSCIGTEMLMTGSTTSKAKGITVFFNGGLGRARRFGRVRGFEYALLPATQPPPRRSGHANRRADSANLRIPLWTVW